MGTERRKHYSYLLRLWQAGDSNSPAWRITLEDVSTRERHGFADLAGLAAFLDARIDGGDERAVAMLTRREDG